MSEGLFFIGLCFLAWVIIAEAWNPFHKGD